MVSIDDILKDFKAIFVNISYPWFCTGRVFLYDNTASCDALLSLRRKGHVSA